MCHMRYEEELKVLFMYLFIVFYKTPLLCGLDGFMGVVDILQDGT